MKKIINPCMCDTGYMITKMSNAFAEINFHDGKLSIHGVIGPMRNGNAKGSCGQCVDEIRNGEPTDDWTPEMLQKFCDIWDRWHLNDMRPYCEHQKELGWDEIAEKTVVMYNWSLKQEASRKQRDAERKALEALRKGETFTPSQEQVKFAALPYFATTWEPLNEEMKEYYEEYVPSYRSSTSKEEKLLGWLRPDEHPDGILSKPCPVCGYKYGTDWKTEEVPSEVIDWLFSLPDTKVRPAWV